MLFIARRYLFSKKSHSVVNIIAGVSLFSVAVPVAAIIILLSVFNGFGGLVEGLNESVDADLTISPIRGRYFDVHGIDTLRLRDIEGIESFAFVNEQMMMMEYAGREMVLSLRGVSDNYSEVVDIGDRMRGGEFRVALGDLDRLVLGNAAAVKLRVRNLRQSFVRIYSLRESRLSSLAPIVDFVRDSARVSGIYIVDAQSEERYAYSSLRMLKRLTGREDEISSIVVKVSPESSVREVKSVLQDVVGEGFKIQSREELNPLLYDIIRYEKWGIIFISAMVMLIASFSLIGIVAMLIIEKRDDMLTLRAMGATMGDLRRIFFTQGMLISGIGVLLGLVIGVGVTMVQQIWGVVKLPMGGFVVDSYPVDLQFVDVVGVVIMSLSVAAVLSYIVTCEMIKNR
ncbi:MAG: FtsX-like permease family protein [Rikenellaceae bacterium]